MKKKTQKEIDFSNQIFGTIFTLLELISIIMLLLGFIGLFLPICNIDIINVKLNIFDFTGDAVIGFVTCCLIYLLPASSMFLINHFTSKLVNEEIKTQSKKNLIIAIGSISLILVIILTAINLPILAISSNSGIDSNLLSAGAGTIMIYITSIINALMNCIISVFYFAIFNDKLKVENFKKIITLNKK